MHPPHLADAAATAPAAVLADESLLLAYGERGDRGALEELVRRHQPVALRVAMRYLRHASDAEDAVQTAFMQVQSHAHQHRAGASVRSWIISVVANTCLMRLREEDRRRLRQRAALPDAPPMVGDPDERLTREECTALVQHAVDHLPPVMRSAIWYRYRQEKSIPESAVLLGLPERDVRSQLEQGMGLLRARLRQSGFGEGALGAALLRLAGPTPCPPPLAAPTPSPPAPWQPALLGGLVAAGVLALALQAWPTARPRPQPPAEARLPGAPACASALDQRVGLQLAHARLPEALRALQRAAAPGSFRYACFATLDARSWSGVTITLPQAPLHQILNTLTAAYQLGWQERHGVIEVYAPQDAGALSACQQQLRQGDHAERLAAIAELGGLAHPGALRELVLALGSQDPELVQAARSALSRMEPAIPEAPRSSVGAGEAGDLQLLTALHRQLDRESELDTITASWCARLGDGTRAQRLLGYLAAASGNTLGRGLALRLALEQDGSLHASVNGVDAPRGQVAYALAALGTPEIVHALAGQVDPARGFYDQEAVLSALGVIGGAEAIAAISRTFNGAMPADRWTEEEAIDALGTTRDPRAIAVIAAIARRDHARASTVAVAAAALAAVGSAPAVDALAALLRDPLCADRGAELTAAFAQLEDPVPLSRAVAAGEDPRLQGCLQAARARLGEGLAIEQIGARLRAGTDPQELLLQEATALAQSHLARAWELLQADSTASAPARLRRAVAGVLLLTRCPAAIPVVLTLCSDRDAQVRRLAIGGLSEAPADSRVDAELALLALSPASEERSLAVRALRTRQDPSAHRQLSGIMAGDADPAVRLQAIAALMTSLPLGSTPEDLPAIQRIVREVERRQDSPTLLAQVESIQAVLQMFPQP